MAFGRAPDMKNHKPPVTEAQIWAAHVRSEESASFNWASRWGWILKEYEELNKKLREVSKSSQILSDIKEKKIKDRRSLKPVPKTGNGNYGWVASNGDFYLEKYGPDTFKPPPLDDGIEKFSKYNFSRPP